MTWWRDRTMESYFDAGLDIDDCGPGSVPESERQLQLLIELNEALEARVLELEEQVEMQTYLGQLNEALEARVQELEATVQERSAAEGAAVGAAVAERDELLTRITEHSHAVDEVSNRLSAAKRSWPAVFETSAWPEIAGLMAGLRDLLDSSDAKLHELRASLQHVLQSKEARVDAVPGKSDIELQAAMSSLTAEIRALSFNNALLSAEKRELQASLTDLRSELRLQAARSVPAKAAPVCAIPAPDSDVDAALNVLASRSGGAWTPAKDATLGSGPPAQKQKPLAVVKDRPSHQKQKPLEVVKDRPSHQKPQRRAGSAAVWITDSVFRKAFIKRAEAWGPEQPERRLEDLQVRQLNLALPSARAEVPRLRP